MTLRIARLALGSLLVAATAIACAAPPPVDAGGNAARSSSDPTKDKTATATAPEPPTAPGAGAPPPGAGSSDGDDDDDDTTGSARSPTATSAFDCSGAGIAAFGDQLVTEARKTCTSDGEGVVTNTNYECMKDPIFKLAPPFPAAAYERVTTWAKNGNNFSGKTTLLQCVDFAFIVTAAVCGKPINDGDANIGPDMDIPGYTYVSASAGAPQAGDVLVMPVHIAITAKVIGSGRIRVAEANCLTQDGEMTDGDDTGVISNTRTDTTRNSWIQGWYRKQ